jgi:hypothetical protein
MEELSKTVVHRTPIETERVPTYIPGGIYHPFHYRFTVTLEDGSKHTLTGVYPTDGQARNAALRRSLKIIDHGYQEGV